MHFEVEVIVEDNWWFCFFVAEEVWLDHSESEIIDANGPRSVASILLDNLTLERLLFLGLVFVTLETQ
jgi:hypothetical protein